MSGAELVPQNNTELVANNNGLYGTYDGITFFQDAAANVSIGPGIDEKILEQARRGEISQDDVRFYRRLANGVAGTNVLVNGGLAAVAPFIGESPTLSLVSGAVLAVVIKAESYIMPHKAKKRQQAITAMSEGLVRIPPKDIDVNSDALAEQTYLATGAIVTTDLVAILQKMQTSHLPQEAASIFEANHPATVNPALVVKGGLLGLMQEDCGRFLHSVFDHAQDLQYLTTSLHRHAPLAVTEKGQEGLSAQTTLLLGHLGEIAASFVDLKAAETTPKIENLIDVADEPNLKAGLEEAKHTLWQPALSLQRYELVTRNWGDAGTL